MEGGLIFFSKENNLFDIREKNQFNSLKEFHFCEGMDILLPFQ